MEHMMKRGRVLAGLTACILATVGGAAYGTSYTFQGNGGTTAAPISGDWNTAAYTAWSPTGLASNKENDLFFNGSGDTAYTANQNFAAGFILNSITLNSSATITETISGNTLRFQTDTVPSTPVTPSITQNGSGAFTISTALTIDNSFTLNGNGTGLVTLGGWGGSQTLAKSGTSTFAITGNLSTTGAISITGGALSLSGANGSMSATTGSVTLTTGGTLLLDNNAGNNTNRVADGKAIILSGGQLKISGMAGGASSEVVNASLTSQTVSTVTAVAGSGGSTLLQLGGTQSFSRNSGAMLVIRGANLGTSDQGTADGANIILATAPTQFGAGGAAGTTTQSIVPWAVGDTDTVNGIGNQFVTYDGAGTTARGFRLLTDSEYATTITSGATTAENVRLNAPQTLTANTTINAVKFEAANNGISVGTGQTLTLSAGVIINHVGANTIDGGSVILGSEGVINNNANLTINSIITGTNGLTKNGTGTLTLGDISGLSGPMNLMGTGSTQIMNGNVTISSLLGTGVLGLATNSTLYIGDSGSATFSGSVSGSGANLNKIGTGTQILKSIDATGTVTVYSGTLATTVTTKLAFANTGLVVKSGATFTLGDNSMLNSSILVEAGGTLNIGSTGTNDATDRLGKSITLNGANLTYSTQKGVNSSNIDKAGTLYIGPGTSSITLVENAGQSANATSVCPSNLSRNGNGTLLVKGDNLGLIVSGTVKRDFLTFTTAPTTQLIGGSGGVGTTNIPIFPWLIADAQNGSGINLATYANGGTGVRPLSTSEYSGFAGVGSNADYNVRETGAVATPNSMTINALALNNAGSAYSVTNTNNTLTITSGATLFTGTGAITIDGGTIAYGSAEAILHQTNTAGAFITSAITGTAGLTKGSTGPLTLSGDNSGLSGTITVNAGTLTAASPNALGSGNGLAINATAQVALTAGHDKVLRVSSLSMASGAKLDLADNDMVASGTSLAAVTALVLNGNVLTSTADSNKQGLAIVSGLAFHALPGNSDLSTFHNQTVGDNDVIVKYGPLGDANLDGVITMDDYLAIDTGYLFGGAGGYTNGDFNYDGKVDAADYLLIDKGLRGQFGTSADDLVNLHASWFGPDYLQTLNEITSVPEPTTVSLLGVGLLSLLRRHRRRSV